MASRKAYRDPDPPTLSRPCRRENQAARPRPPPCPGHSEPPETLADSPAQGPAGRPSGAAVFLERGERGAARCRVSQLQDFRRSLGETADHTPSPTPAPSAAQGPGGPPNAGLRAGPRGGAGRGRSQGAAELVPVSPQPAGRAAPASRSGRGWRAWGAHGGPASRSWVLSARAAGGLSVRERPGPIQWPLSAGLFVQEAATSCGAGPGQAGGNAPSRGLDSEAAPAWGQKRWPPPPTPPLAMGRPGLGAGQGAKLGQPSPLRWSGVSVPAAEQADGHVPSCGVPDGDPVWGAPPSLSSTPIPGRG